MDNPIYPNVHKPSITLAEALSLDIDSLDNITICGRVMTKRHLGKLHFLTLQSRACSIQVLSRLDKTDNYDQLVRDINIGDLCCITGSIKLNENKLHRILEANKVDIVTKCLRTMPSNWHGLKDIETRYKQRYLDYIFNPEQQLLVIKRHQLLVALRDFFNERNFVEVETPYLHPLYGGAEAEPFYTHHNHTNQKLYLRIAPELYLKRLLVGGIDKVYEIGRNFRNEGVSLNHNPEFSAIEWYEAYADYNDGRKTTEELLRKVSVELASDVFAGQFYTVSIEAEVKKLVGNYELSTESIQDFYSRHRLDHDCSTYEEYVMHAFDKLIAPTLIKPTFVVGYFSSLSHLARPNDQDPNYCDRWELYVKGVEIANCYSELNDPKMQRDNMGVVDEDYITALEYGMPSAVGVGLGTDRLLKILTNSYSIRDVISFTL